MCLLLSSEALMPVFPKPSFHFSYSVPQEIQHLSAHKQTRGIPGKANNRLLVATWNVANFGAQKRRDEDISLIAEITGWFDIVALQECRENYGHLFDLLRKLPSSYRVIMSDVAGNNERMAFIYDSKKLKALEEIGEIAFPPSDYKHIKLPGITKKFDGFDRTPYLATFEAGNTSFVFANVHLFFGDEKPSSIARRALETFAVARWADRRNKSDFSFTRELVALGDFNLPKVAPTDPIFKALTKLGLELPGHSTQIASAIASDKNYDQIAVFPKTTQEVFTGNKGVFDYDAVIFPALWANGTNKTNFKAYLRYYISDHRPMWAEFKIG
jgi:endonuclease/exonuclease/phosphatase family metal-dependent hydrolase